MSMYIDFRFNLKEKNKMDKKLFTDLNAAVVAARDVYRAGKAEVTAKNEVVFATVLTEALRAAAADEHFKTVGSFTYTFDGKHNKTIAHNFQNFVIFAREYGVEVTSSFGEAMACKIFFSVPLKEEDAEDEKMAVDSRTTEISATLKAVVDDVQGAASGSFLGLQPKDRADVFYIDMSKKVPLSRSKESLDVFRDAAEDMLRSLVTEHCKELYKAGGFYIYLPIFDNPYMDLHPLSLAALKLEAEKVGLYVKADYALEYDPDNTIEPYQTIYIGLVDENGEVVYPALKEAIGG